MITKPELKIIVLGLREFTVKDLTIQFYEELQAMKLVPLQEPQTHEETLRGVILDNADRRTTKMEIENAVREMRRHLESFLSF